MTTDLIRKLEALTVPDSTVLIVRYLFILELKETGSPVDIWA